MVAPIDLLQQYWGYDRFLPRQEDIIGAVLDGRDTLAILPTGAGKSICYQVPTMARSGICLVISPLVALMRDQVESLRRRGITSFALHAGMTKREIDQTLTVSAESNCKFLYISPERLESRTFLEYLPALDINLIAVDEAHCISQWGYDFRPSYLKIAQLRKELPGVPVLALTATATREIEKDICQQLLFTGGLAFRNSFERPQIGLRGIESESKTDSMLYLIKNSNGSAIVYCGSRKKTGEIKNALAGAGIRAVQYHAGLSQEERNGSQKAWKENNAKVMVCTNAFGMGIDHPGVRMVIHADLPDCPENYYQESGRAARDGKAAEAVLLYNRQDIDWKRRLPEFRFPDHQLVRQVYQALVNYLQVPAGGGEDQYYAFDPTDFATRFQQNPFLVTQALRILEQAEILAMQDQTFIPSKVSFEISQSAFRAFEREKPEWKPLTDLLLRTYPGIFDEAMPVNEKKIAASLHQGEQEVRSSLSLLHKQGIISYFPKREGPQIYFIQPRLRTEDLYLDQSLLQLRKQQFELRTEAMISYAELRESCRSQWLSRYFGEHNTRPCGKCDNCIRLSL